MSDPLKNLQPEHLFKHFKAIADIPHGSYHTEKLSNAILAFAEEKHLNAERDDVGNVVITVPATPGHEDAAPVILQGHLDMVTVAKPGVIHDFDIDPITLVLKGDDLYADGTTLGADDGAGVAMALALLDEPDFVHPKLYLVFTTEEEVGMDGAYALDYQQFADAKSMINLDSEDEGTATVGCAGGTHMKSTLPIRRVKAKGLAATLSVSGLAGGHSGDEIDQFGLNAVKVLTDALCAIAKDVDFSIVDLKGGERDNAIPTSAEATLLIAPSERVTLDQTVNALQHTFRAIAGKRDQGMTLALDFPQADAVEASVLDPDSEARVLGILSAAPTGVVAMNRSVPGAVNTSLNLGVAATSDKTLSLVFLIRSDHDAARDMLCGRVTRLIDLLGGTTGAPSAYPAWPARETSPLLDTMSAIWQAQTGKALTPMVIHGGLECALFAHALPDLDIVSIGPDNIDIHTANEHMSIPSFKRTYAFLKAAVEALA